CRLSEPAANFVFGEVSKRGDIQTELIDIRKIPLAVDDAGEALKDTQFSATVARADGLILVVPEYNHRFPGLLKHVLDTNLKEYIHKAVGVCGVSAGPFGGARMIQSLVPVLRELGLVTRAPLENPALSFGIKTTPGETKCMCASRNFLAVRSTSSVVIIVCQ